MISTLACPQTKVIVERQPLSLYGNAALQSQPHPHSMNCGFIHHEMHNLSSYKVPSDATTPQYTVRPNWFPHPLPPPQSKTATCLII